MESREGGHERLTRHWFAKELLGSPVRIEPIWDGGRVLTMTLVEHLTGND